MDKARTPTRTSVKEAICLNHESSNSVITVFTRLEAGGGGGASIY